MQTVLPILLGALTLSSARTLSKHKPTVAPSVDCEHLTDALYRVYKEVILPLYSREQVKAEIMTAVGIDPENREQLMQFSCGLQGARSIKDVSRLFLMPHNLVRQLYQELMDEISKCGGVQGCQVYMSMMNDLADWLHSVKYGKWPLRTTARQTEKFLLHMAGDYGKDFLMSPNLMAGTGTSISQLLITRDNARLLAKTLTDAHNIAELGRISGYPTHLWKSLDEGLSTVARAGKYVRRSNKALKDLLVISDKMGLVYLPEDSRAISAKRNSIF